MSGLGSKCPRPWPEVRGAARTAPGCWSLRDDPSRSRIDWPAYINNSSRELAYSTVTCQGQELLSNGSKPSEPHPRCRGGTSQHDICHIGCRPNFHFIPLVLSALSLQPLPRGSSYSVCQRHRLMERDKCVDDNSVTWTCQLGY